jgi:hypothetical protein
MIRVARVGLPDGADLTGLKVHRRIKAAGHAGGRSSATVGVSFMVDDDSAHFKGPRLCGMFRQERFGGYGYGLV